MADNYVTMQVEDSIVSSKTFSSDLKPTEFKAVEVVVKNEPIAEDAKTCVVDKLVLSLTTHSEGRKIKAESIDPLSEGLVRSAESLIPLCTNSSEKKDIKAESINTLSEGFMRPAESSIPLCMNSSEKREIKAEGIDTLSEDLVQPGEILIPLCTNSSDCMDANVTIKKEEDSEICIEEERFADCNSSLSFKNEENHYCLGKVYSTGKVNGKIGENDDIVRMPHVSLTEAQNSPDIEASLKAVPPVSTSKSSFQCPDCESSYWARNLLRTHLADNHNKPFLCPFFHCPAAFSKSGEWNLHIASHSGEKIFSCTQCKATFKDKEHLTQHRTSHFKEGQFPCAYCSIVFSESGEFVTHLATHGTDIPLSCGQCPATFKRKSLLKQHLLSHSRQKSISCPHCGSAFKEKSNLQRHIKRHCVHTLQMEVNLEQRSIKAHAVKKMNEAADKIGESETLSQVPASSSSAKTVDCTEYDVLPVSFKCLECGSRYQTRQRLRMHQKYQHGKPFSCIHCPAAFFKNEELSLHLGSHSIEKLFA